VKKVWECVSTIRHPWGGSCPGGSCPRWQFSGWHLYW